MNQASIPLYIRFGEIPSDGKSKVHRSDHTIRNEGGVSVWRACEVDNRFYPILPEHPNESTIADYFDFLCDSKSNVYLVTGTEMFLERADREPLLMDPIIIKDITYQYRKDISKTMDKKEFSKVLTELQELREYKANIEKISGEEVRPKRGDKIKIIKGIHSKYTDPTATIMQVRRFNDVEDLYQVSLSITNLDYRYDSETWATLERNEFEIIERSEISDEELQQYIDNASKNTETENGEIDKPSEVLRINTRVKLLLDPDVHITHNSVGVIADIATLGSQVLYGIRLHSEDPTETDLAYFRKDELEIL